MNKKILLPALFFLTVVAVFAFTQKTGKPAETLKVKPVEETGIQFIEGDWNKALAEAKKQNKPIFLDAYTTWCGPCRLLKRNTFTDKAVGEFFNKNFINVALDMEKGDGLAVAERYQIRAYPTLIITDAELKSSSISEGYMSPAELLAFGKYVIEKKK